MDSRNCLSLSNSQKMASSSNKKSPERGLFALSLLFCCWWAWHPHPVGYLYSNSPSLIGAVLEVGFPIWSMVKRSRHHMKPATGQLDTNYHMQTLENIIWKNLVHINPFAHHSTPIAKITHAALNARINRPSIVGFTSLAPIQVYTASWLREMTA